MENFGTWLLRELENRSMSQADLSRACGITTAQISRIISGTRSPGKNTLSAIARALRLPPELIYQKAGLLPTSKSSPLVDEITHLAGQLPESDIFDLIDLARSKLQRHERTQNAGRKA